MLGLQCVVYMGSEDTRRQALNVFRMRLLEAEVIAVESGHPHPEGRHQRGHPRLGYQRGVHPLPHRQRRGAAPLSHAGAGLPVGHKQGGPGADYRSRGPFARLRVACVGGGSNAIGTFYEFIGDEEVSLVGVEAGGEGVESGRHSATLSAGRPGVLHGSMSYLLQDQHGPSPRDPTAISAGLDYPGVGRSTAT